MGFIIAPASANDAETVAELTRELLEEIMAMTGARHFTADASVLAALCREFLAGGEYAAYLAYHAGKAVGFITLSETRALYAGGCFGIIPECYVHPDFRGRGLGAKLLAAAREHARSRGWKRLEVTTPPLPVFDRTLNFYRANGFEVAGGRKLKSAIG